MTHTYLLIAVLPRCTEMIADYSAEIKIVIFQPLWKRQRDGRICRFLLSRQTLADYWTKVHKIWTGCTLIIAIEPLESRFATANPFSNAEAKSEGGRTRRLRMTPIFIWLP